MQRLLNNWRNGSGVPEIPQTSSYDDRGEDGTEVLACRNLC